MAEIFPTIIDAALLQKHKFNIDYNGAWEILKFKNDPLLQFKVYLLCPERPNFDHFVRIIVEYIETGQNRQLCILLDACSDHMGQLSSEVILQIMAQLQNRQFDSAKVINVASRFCSLSPHSTKSLNLIIEMAETSDDKLKSRLILKLRDMARNGLNIRSVEKQLHEFYQNGDDEVKDSVLELILNSTILPKFNDTVLAALESEAGFIRATALKCLTKLISSDYETNLVRLSQLTSSDLDYTVRRAGIQCIVNMFTQCPVEVIKVLHSQDTEPIVHDTSPILQFKRPSVNTLMALLELLAFDDDWEVKMSVIKLIDFVYWKEKKSKTVAQMVDLLQEMTRDCDPHVAEQAQVKLSSIMDLGKLLSIGRIFFSMSTYDVIVSYNIF